MTNNLKRLGLALAVALILPASRAYADLNWDFSYTVSDGTNTSGVSMGTLTTTSTPAGGPYTVTGISGTFTFDNITESIAGLIVPNNFAQNDNLLSPTSPFVNQNGISFSVPIVTVEGNQIDAVNVFFNNDNTFYSVATGNNPSNSAEFSVVGTSVSTFQLTPVTSVVPEPSTAIVAVFGAVAFLAYGWSRHRRAQLRQAAA